jgi:hypothetical protein
LLVSPVADGSGAGGAAVVVAGFSHALAHWEEREREREKKVCRARELYIPLSCQLAWRDKPLTPELLA